MKIFSEYMILRAVKYKVYLCIPDFTEYLRLEDIFDTIHTKQNYLVVSVRKL